MTDTAMLEAPPLVPNPENAVNALDFLREAIAVPSLAEVKELIKETILDYNMLNEIVVVKDDVRTELPDEARHYLFPDIFTTVSAGIPTALIGPAGAGKSTVVEQVAKAVNLPFYLQNAVTGTHELAGYCDATGKYHSTAFREAFSKGGLMLIDEVDSSDPGALKWINTALANGYAMFPDSAERVLRHADFKAVIAANTFGSGADRVYVGANQLDASTLDRFVFINFGYDEKLELALAGNPSWVDRVQRLRKSAAEEKARIVISPRASINGAKLLAQGWDAKKVEDAVIWKGIDPELKKRIDTAKTTVYLGFKPYNVSKILSKTERKALRNQKKAA